MRESDVSNEDLGQSSSKRISRISTKTKVASIVDRPTDLAEELRMQLFRSYDGWSTERTGADSFPGLPRDVKDRINYVLSETNVGGEKGLGSQRVFTLKLAQRAGA